MLFRNRPKQIEQKNMSKQSIFGCNNLLVHFKLDFCYMLSLLSGFKAFLLELENMQFQRVKNPCPCCNVQQCRLSTSANQDLNRKEILQPLIWPTEQPPQIFQFDLDFHQRHYQQAFSFQFQLQIAEGYDGEQRGHPEKPSKSMETREKQKQTIHDNDSNDYFKPFDGLHGNGLLDRIQSILNDQFINIQLMQEESPEDRLVDKEWTQSNNSSAPKNANMPKFLIRLFLQYFAQFGEMGLQAMDQSVRKFINDYQRRYKMNPKSFYKLDQLIDLLRLQEWIKERNIVLRRILNAIIRAKGRSQIIKSTQLKRKISYLNATKVYSLRCLNYSLAQRLQSK